MEEEDDGEDGDGGEDGDDDERVCVRVFFLVVVAVIGQCPMVSECWLPSGCRSSYVTHLNLLPCLPHAR